MRVRQSFAAAFAVLLLFAAYIGLFENRIPSYHQSDKGLHFITFFLLTLTFYWILDTNRRRLINLTLLVCTAGLSIVSEAAQGILPNDRNFDPYDIVSNVLGSALALALCSWYHKRMLERRRKNKHLDIIPGDELNENEEERDVELGDVDREQETGIIAPAVKSLPDPNAATATNVTEELDHWDENEEDWEQDDLQGDDAADGKDAAKKRAD